MQYCLDELFDIISTLSNEQQIYLKDIPSIDLYMDQVTSFFDTSLQSHKRKQEEPILTKTMINNYAKAKILTPIKNKKYNKTQIILLVLIYNLKQVLSLDDIKSLLSPFLELLEEDFENYSLLLFEVYNYYLYIKTSNINDSKEVFKVIDNLKVSNPYFETHLSLCKNILSILCLSYIATLNKRAAESIIDNYFK